MSVKVVHSGPGTIKVSVSSLPAIKVNPPEVNAVKVSSNVISSNKLIPAGGAAGSFLKKVSADNYDVEWSDSAGSLFEVVDDQSPTLGGNLDVDTFKLFTTAANQDIVFTPTGHINLDGTVKFKRFSTPPTFFAGGMYADDNDNLYFGVTEPSDP